MLRARITEFYRRMTEFEPVITGTKPSEPLAVHNAWLQAEYDGKTMVYERVRAIIDEVFGPVVGSSEGVAGFMVGDPVAILDPQNKPLRFGKVVSPPAYQQGALADRVHICWDGNPSRRTYSFDPTQTHHIVNLRDSDPGKEE